MTGPQQMLIVLAIAVVLFGGAKLPQLARSVGQAQKEFQKGLREGAASDDTSSATDTESTTKES